MNLIVNLINEYLFIELNNIKILFFILFNKLKNNKYKLLLIIE